MIGMAHAQERRIRGKVISETGDALPGVSVLITGTSTGTQTDIDGNFQIQSPVGAKSLTFSYIGYVSKTFDIGQATTMNVTLAASSSELSEVVVVGYGSQNRSRMTTSVSRLSGTEISEQPVPNFGQAMQGRIAGVQVTAGSGRPGAPIQMNIRGRASINAGNNPLYVIDGVIMPSNNNITPNAPDNFDIQGSGVAPLANLNPEDIESIEVLKDAAAAAIYGSRGSNGVVLITTKSGGKRDKSVVSLSAYNGFQSLTKKKKLLNATEYRTLYNEALVNTRLDPLFTEDQIKNPTNNVNWVDEILADNSNVNNVQLSVTSGGTSKTQFYSSLNYFSQDGILRESKFDRYALRTNVTHDINSFIRLGSNIAISKSLRDETPVDNSIYSPFPRAQVARPDQAIFNDNGTFASNDFNNPLHMFQSKNNIALSNIFNSTYAEIKILPTLRFKSSVGIDYTYLNQQTFNPSTSLSGEGSNGSAVSGYVETQNILTTQTLSYNDDFFDNRLNVNGTLVYEYQWNDRWNNRVEGVNFPSDLTHYIVSAAQITSGTSELNQFRMESMLARINLAWENKYLLGASLRRDGSSRIPKSGRYGYFPSVSAGWVLSEEEFLKHSSFVNNLKIRASYGETGNQEGIGIYTAYRQIGGGFNYNDSPGFALSTIGSPNLRWETTRQIDIGLEFSILNNRLDFSGDWYRKNTVDLLLNRPIPQTTGFNTILENIGSMKSSGFDFQVTSHNFINDFKWNTSFNISTYQNEVTELYQDQPIDGSFVTRTAVGQPLGAFYLIKSLGVNPATGDMMYENIDGSVDDSGNPTINSSDRQFLGNPLPEFFGGITNNFSYQNFDLNIFFQYSYGNDIYNMGAQGVGGYYSLGGNITAGGGVPTNVFKEAFDNRWTPDNTSAEYPRAIGGQLGTSNTQNSSRFLEDGSYLRLKLVTLGYTLPKNFTSKVGLNNARIYVSAQNPLTFTKYSGYDPEVSSESSVANAGVDQTSIPQMKTFMFGINIGL